MNGLRTVDQPVDDAGRVGARDQGAVGDGADGGHGGERDGYGVWAVRVLADGQDDAGIAAVCAGEHGLLDDVRI
jgi:hypothetical protein